MLLTIAKLRLALTILHAARLRDWRSLEAVTAEQWLVRLCGRRTYERFWKPLLLAKLGPSYRRVSAVFIWTYIQRLFSARDGTARGREQLGHVTGGYKTILQRLEQLIRRQGGLIHTGRAVRAVRRAAGGGLHLECDESIHHFDKVVSTGPSGVLRRIAAPELLSSRGADSQVEYLGVLCLALLTRRPLVPFYVVNVADEQFPLTGVIGMSNVVALDETAGLHLTYFPKYVLSDDPLLDAPDTQLREMFLDGVRRMFPDLDQRGVEGVHLNRARQVQPLHVLHYSQLVDNTSSRHEDFYILNTTQLVSGTLNNNEVVKAVDRFVRCWPDGRPQEPDTDLAGPLLGAVRVERSRKPPQWS